MVAGIDAAFAAGSVLHVGLGEGFAGAGDRDGNGLAGGRADRSRVGDVGELAVERCAHRIRFVRGSDRDGGLDLVAAVLGRNFVLAVVDLDVGLLAYTRAGVLEVVVVGVFGAWR